MQYDLSIPPENWQAHLDLEADIQARGNGLFTFILRVHDGRITDYNLMEAVDVRTKYFGIKTTIIEEFVVSCVNRERNTPIASWPTNL